MQLSLCMIVRDEAFFIEECLSYARPYVDEIVVVDTGSVDGTQDIVRRYADTLLDFPWVDNFSAARNTGLEAATGDWILVLDADERVVAEDFAVLRQAMVTDEFDGYYLQTRNYMNRQPGGWRPVEVDDPNTRGFAGFTTHRIMKLFRRRDDIRYRGRVHEIVDGSVAESARGELPAIIHHYGDANDDKPRRERALRYLALMEEDLAQEEDARLLAIAGSSAMHFAGDYTKAARYLHRAADLGYERQITLESAAEAYYRGGNFGTALSLYKTVYDAGSRSPVLCLNLANLLVRSGDKTRGKQLLQECLDLGGIDPTTDGAIRGNIEFLSS